MEMFFFLSLQRVSIKNSYVKYHGNCIFSIWHGLYVIFMFLKHSVPQLTDQASSSSSNIKNTCRNPRSTLKAIRSLRLLKQLCYQPQIRIPRLPFPVFFLSLAVRILSPSVFTIQDWFYDLCTDFDPCFYHLDGVCARMPFIKCLGIRYLQKNYTLMKIINFFPSYEHIEESQMRFASINIYSENINICTKMICHGIKIITKFIIHAHLSNIKVSYKTRCFK